MKRFFKIEFGFLLVLILAITTVAEAQSLFVGTWKLNLDKSKFIGASPLEWTDVIREVEDDQFEVNTKIVLPENVIITEVIVWARQGGVVKYLQGGAEGAMDVMTTISPNEWILTRIVDGKQIGLMKFQVSQNSKVIRYTLRMPGLEGEAVFDKQ